MSGWDDIENRMNALKAEIEAITQSVRSLRKQKALEVVKRAEQKLIDSQRDARSLNLPIAILGSGQCKHQETPYSLIKLKPPITNRGKPPKPKQ